MDPRRNARRQLLGPPAQVRPPAAPPKPARPLIRPRPTREVLFVTSFSPDLYEASGRQLIESFARVGQPGRLLVCYEGGRPPLPEPPCVGFDLDADPFLKNWLAANRDVIPEHLGGLTKICTCPDAEKRHSRHHVRGCHWQWMNRNASRWFRKVASLRRAAALAPAYDADLVVWLDSDVVFKRALPSATLAAWLGNYGVFVCRGHRPAVEAGVVGLALSQGGRAFVDALCREYVSRDYLKLERWDDGFVMAVLADRKVCRVRDLVHPTKWKNKTNNVIPTTVLAPYLDHLKGRHGSGLGVML